MPKTPQPAKKQPIKAAEGFFKRFGFAYLVQGVPVIGILGHLTFPSTRLVWREMKGDVTEVEGILMVIIAGTLDIISFIIALIELMLAGATLGIFSSILGWFKWLIIGIWLLVRSRT